MTQAHKRNPRALPITGIFALSSRDGSNWTKQCCVAGGTGPMQTQPGHHPGILPVNITRAATNSSYELKKTNPELSKRQQNSVVSHLQSPPEPSCLILQRETEACNTKFWAPHNWEQLWPSGSAKHSRKNAWAHDTSPSPCSHFFALLAGPSGWTSHRFGEMS